MTLRERLSPWSDLLGAFAVILFVDLFSFGFCIRQLGFYMEDWNHLELIATGAGWEGLKRLIVTSGYVRPTSYVLFGILGKLGGLSPLFYHACLLLADAAAALACYAWLERLTRDRSLALLAAILTVVYPVHPATHHWLTNLPQTAAEALGYAGLLAHLHWLEARTWRRGAAAGALFLAGYLSYEGIAFLPLVAAVAAYFRARDGGLARKQAFLRLPADTAPLLAGFLAGAAWQWVIARGTNPKHLAWSLGWTWTVYASGAESLFWEPVKLARICLLALLPALDDARTLLLALFVAVAAALLARRDPEREEPAARGLGMLLALAAADYLAAYAPYALSGQYEPQVVGVMSRTNGGGSSAAALLLALALGRLPRLLAGRLSLPPRWFRAAGIVAVLAPCTWINWYISLQWAGAWAVQQDILNRVERWAPKLPLQSTLLLSGAPTHHNGTEVFYESWGFAAAFRLRTGRKDVATIVLGPSMKAGPEGLLDYRSGKPALLAPYKDLYQFDVAADRLQRVVP